MASRRTVDTSAMFKSMTGRSNAAPEKETIGTEPENAAETSSAESSVSIEPKKQDKNKGADKGVSVEGDSGTGRKKKDAVARRKQKPDPQDRQTIKLGFYLTPRIYEAIRLHKAIHAIGTHNDSQIVNKALSLYLEKEIRVLQNVDADLGDEARLTAAMMRLLNEKENGVNDHA